MATTINTNIYNEIHENTEYWIYHIQKKGGKEKQSVIGCWARLKLNKILEAKSGKYRVKHGR